MTTEKCKEIEKKIKENVEKHPFVAMGVGFGMGLFVGILLSKHR